MLPLTSPSDPAAAVDLFWIPLGAGGHVVRRCGRAFEAASALRQHRPRRELYHAALEVTVDGERHTIEMAPVWNLDAPDRGAVATGAVGHARLIRWRLFRYEIRCWRGGVIPDLGEAVDSPQRLSDDAARARRVLELAPVCPTATWGLDEQHTGDMWNSNSLVAWLLARSGHDVDLIHPPRGGGAPGWEAGLVVASRQAESPPPGDGSATLGP